MGHGASTTTGPSTIFSSPEIVEGSRLMKDSEDLRLSFVIYIKSGVWIDALAARFPAKKTAMTVAERLAREKTAFFGYLAPHGKDMESEARVLRKRENSMCTDVSQSDHFVATDAASVAVLSAVMSECYVDIEKSFSFKPREICSILFNILLPMYFASSEHQRFLRYGNEFGEVEMMDATDDEDSGDQRNIPAQLRRAQGLLLGCAALLDESVLLDALGAQSWVDAVETAFDRYELAITIQDTSADHRPIVFANQAFLHLTGHSKSSLRGRGLDVLAGPATEALQRALLNDVLRAQQPIKLALTHHTKTGKTFTNLLALVHSGPYAIAVHVPLLGPVCKDEIEMASDTLLLLTMVVKAPVIQPAVSEKTASNDTANLRASLSLTCRTAGTSESTSTRGGRYLYDDSADGSFELSAENLRSLQLEEVARGGADRGSGGMDSASGHRAGVQNTGGEQDYVRAWSVMSFSSDE